MSTREDEQAVSLLTATRLLSFGNAGLQRTITIKSTSVSMVFDVPTTVKKAPVKGQWNKVRASVLQLF